MASFTSVIESKDPTISNISYGDSVNSRFVKPKRMFYEQDGQAKAWDLVESHDAVAILVYHRTKKCFMLVRQFRPAVYCSTERRIAAENQKIAPENPEADEAKSPAQSSSAPAVPPHSGFTFELVAGLVDKKHKSLAETAKEEVEEEIGYRVDASSLQYVSVYRSGVGVMGNSAKVYYAEIDDSMKVSDGGGIDQELIQVVELPAKDAREFALSSSVDKPAGLMFAIFWWFEKFRDRLDELL